jgi:hypothetical protein
MTKTPEELHEEAREYLDLKASIAGNVFREAIEQVAKALDRTADIVEAEPSHPS